MSASAFPLITNVGSQVNMEIMCGTDFSTTMTMVNAYGATLNLTGCLVTAAIKRAALSSLVALYFNVAVANDPTTGVVTLSLSNGDNALDGGANLADPLGQYVWDLKLVDPNGLISRPLYGSICFISAVTP